MPLGLIATAQPAGVPRVELALAWDIPENVIVTRRDPDRSRPVRGAEPVYLAEDATWTGVDYEAPFGVPVVYEMAPEGGGRPDRLVSNTVTLNPTAWYPNDVGWSTEQGAVWLRHLTIPALSMPVDLSNAESPAFKQTRTVLDVVGRRSPLVITDARRKNPTTTYDVRTWSLEEAEKLRELLADNSVLLLTVPAGVRWGIRHEYLAVGDVTEERLWQEWAPFEGRVFHLPCEVVDRPVGGAVYVDCSYWAAQRGVPSYAALRETYRTYGDMAECRRVTDAPDAGGTVRFLVDENNQGTYTEPAVLLTTTIDATEGETYRFFFQQWVRNANDVVTVAVYYAHTDPDPLSGLVMATATVPSAGEDPVVLTSSGDFTAWATDTYTIALSITPPMFQPVDDATDADHLRMLTVSLV